jgi:pimeloyl-ACP methyl ester carboxylesterase
MKKAIILHGGPSKEEYYDPNAPSMSNSHWLPWLQGQLLKHEIATNTPEIPHSFDWNSWPTWVKEVERFEIGPETILVGHSVGGGFWVKYLSLHPEIKVGKVVLVAPWLNPFNKKEISFFDDFVIDPALMDRTKGITIFNADNDEKSIQGSVKIIREKIMNIKYKEFKGLGHFTHKYLPDDKFPELLAHILET